MARNCSFTPGSLLGVFVALCGVSLGIALAFWWLGAPAVLPLAGVELLLVGTALLGLLAPRRRSPRRSRWPNVN